MPSRPKRGLGNERERTEPDIYKGKLRQARQGGEKDFFFFTAREKKLASGSEALNKPIKKAVTWSLS